MVFEDGKYYPMMRAIIHSEEDLKRKREADSQNGVDDGDVRHELKLRYGPLLLKNHHPLLQDYLSREERLCRQVLEAMQGKQTEAANARREELQRELELLERAKKLSV